MDSRLSCLNNVPVEIWHEILALACAPKDETGRYQTNLMPFKVSHVCSKWREIALSEPELWTEISYVVPRIANVPRPHVNLMYLFLERSAGRPLSVSLNIEEHDMDSNPDVHDFLAALFANITRWKTANLSLCEDIDDDAWEDLELLIVQHGAPLLEFLDVTIRELDVNEGWEGTVLLPYQLWKNAPALTKIAIELHQSEENMIYGYLYPDLSDWALCNEIPYHQITHLLIDGGPDSYLRWKEILLVFTVAKNLISCSLTGVSHYLTSSHPIILDQLQHLYLAAASAGDIVTALNKTLTTPSLKSLTYANHRDSSDLLDMDAYAEFIERSGCSLEKIQLFTCVRDSNDLLVWMRCSPTLKVFHAQNTYILQKKVFDKLSEWDELKGEFDICPNLETLAIEFDSPGGLDFFTCTPDMLKKRRCPPNGREGSLKTLSISSRAYDGAVSLRPLLEDPWNLKITHSMPISEARLVFNRDRKRR